MASLAGFFAAMRGAFREVLANPSITSALLTAAVIYSFYYPSAYSSQVAMRLPVAVVDLDRTAESRAVLRMVSAARGVELRLLPQSMVEAERAVAQRKVDGFLLIPKGFARDALSGRTGTLMAYSSSAFMVRNSTVAGTLGSVIQAVGGEIAFDQMRRAGVAEEGLAHMAVPVRLVARPLFNTREGYGSYAVPAVAHLIVQQSLLFGICMLLAERRLAARGVLRMRGNTDFAGFALVMALIALVNALYFNGLAFWIHDYPRSGNVGPMLLVTLFFVPAIVAFSMFIGSFMDKTERAMQALGVFSVPMFFLSGVSWPLAAMPEPIRWFAYTIPTTSGIGAYLEVNQMGAQVHDVAHRLAVLFALTVIYGCLAWYRLVWRKPATVSA